MYKDVGIEATVCAHGTDAARYDYYYYYCYCHFPALCPGLPIASTRRNIHPLTPILIINHPLSASSIYYNS